MDIYKADGRTLNTEKLCFLIWEKQNDPTVVNLLTETLRYDLIYIYIYIYIYLCNQY